LPSDRRQIRSTTSGDSASPASALS
jgi:hypothetical protein